MHQSEDNEGTRGSQQVAQKYELYSTVMQQGISNCMIHSALKKM